jgi:hypothetical protein
MHRRKSKKEKNGSSLDLDDGVLGRRFDLAHLL